MSVLFLFDVWVTRCDWCLKGERAERGVVVVVGGVYAERRVAFLAMYFDAECTYSLSLYSGCTLKTNVEERVKNGNDFCLILVKYF